MKGSAAGVEGFVLDVMRRYGGRAVPLRRGAARVIYAEKPPFAECAGAMVVAFERKALEHHEGAELALPGSPFYLRLLDLTRTHGQTARVYTATVEPLPASPSDRLIRSPRPLRWRAGASAYHAHILFNFAISYESVVTSDDLVSVGYDAVSARFRAPSLVDALHSLWSETLPECPGDWEVVPAPPARSVLAEVLEELDVRTRQKVARARRNMQRYLEREVHGIEAYYRQLIAEEREILNRLSRTSPGDAKEQEKKIQRYQLDWKRRVAEETRHHQCRVHVRLVSAAVVYMPRTALTIEGPDLGAPVTCHFNHFLGTFDGITCARTGGELGPWEVTESGEWISQSEGEGSKGDGEEDAGEETA